MSIPVANRWITPKGGDLKVGICYRCGKPVKLEKATVMEEDLSVAQFHDLGVPEENINALVVVGLDCARTLRRLAVEEGTPNTPERRLEVLERALVFNEKQRQEMLSLQPGDGFYTVRDGVVAYCDFIEQVGKEQLRQAAVKRSKS
ncbi:hypothetical protein [Pseudomonas serbica]|uniref:hypothetical protein n=1 Tax=Pseudomonas serbica TaxID=2965074 RepID=UPI00237A858A|nr:hypothetical protein [Pseudomonas serbica]